MKNIIIAYSIGLSVFISSLCFIFGLKNAAFSVLSGCVVGGVNFFLMARGIQAFNYEPLPKVNSFFKKSFVRFLILALFIIILLNKKWFEITPFFAGLFSYQMIILLKFGFLNRAE